MLPTLLPSRFQEIPGLSQLAPLLRRAEEERWSDLGFAGDSDFDGIDEAEISLEHRFLIHGLAKSPGINEFPTPSCLTYLCVFYGSRLQMGPRGVADLARLGTEQRKLRHLDLSQTAIGDEGAASLSQLSNLESLRLFGCHLTDQAAHAIGRLPKLRRLDLTANAIGDAGAASIANLLHLEVLRLGYNQIGDHGARLLANSPDSPNSISPETA